MVALTTEGGGEAKTEQTTEAAKSAEVKSFRTPVSWRYWAAC